MGWSVLRRQRRGGAKLFERTGSIAFAQLLCARIGGERGGLHVHPRFVQGLSLLELRGGSGCILLLFQDHAESLMRAAVLRIESYGSLELSPSALQVSFLSQHGAQDV